MEIGINDLDFDEFDETTTQDIIETEDDTPVSEEPVETPIEEPISEKPVEGNVLYEFLKSKGIQDVSKIKYENEEGVEEEVSWNTLESKEQLAILNQLTSSESDLDASEIELINAIRNSKMTPSEYLDYNVQAGVQRYIQNNTEQGSNYEIDQFSDDEIFLMDLLARIGQDNITQEEALELLDKTKTNGELFKKQVNAIRSEYKKLEDTQKQEVAHKELAEQQEQYNQFATSVQEQIMNFKEFRGFELNMDQDEQEELYEFITGFDQAGQSILGKAMNDTETLVKMAWFALYGEQMLDDISDYVKQQVAQVRKHSYNKGLEDAKKKQTEDAKPVTVFKPRTSETRVTSIDELDW